MLFRVINNIAAAIHTTLNSLFHKKRRYNLTLQVHHVQGMSNYGTALPYRTGSMIILIIRYLTNRVYESGRKFPDTRIYISRYNIRNISHFFMKRVITGFFILLVALVLITGCTSTPQETQQTETATATPTATQAETVTTPAPVVNETPAQELSFSEEIAVIQKRTDEEGPITMALNTTTDIDLRENPTTGYMWNATVSSGLEIVNDTYIAPETQMPGAGGMHEWVVKAVAPGNQTFSAVYHRPWEPVTDSDTTYTMHFVVTG